MCFLTYSEDIGSKLKKNICKYKGLETLLQQNLHTIHISTLFFFTLDTVTTHPLATLQKQDFKSCIKIVYHLLDSVVLSNFLQL